MVAAMHAEAKGTEVNLSEPSHRLYRVVRRGLLMNPQEVDNLTTLVTNHCKAPINQAEGYLLLKEMWHISALLVHECQDQSVTVTLGNDYTSQHFITPFPQGHPIWNHEPMVPDSLSWATSASHHAGPGILVPDAEQPFMLAKWFQYLLYHGYPSTANQFIWIVFDFAL